MEKSDLTTSAIVLADLATEVRHSSLKRLRLVTDGLESWAPTPGAMSFTDIAYHLVQADEWLFQKLKHTDLAPMRGEAGIYPVATHLDYCELIRRLESIGRERTKLILELSEHQLQSRCFDARYGAEVSVWWIIMRGNLDHEAHHRGQLSVYLRMCGLGGKSGS